MTDELQPGLYWVRWADTSHKDSPRFIVELIVIAPGFGLAYQIGDEKDPISFFNKDAFTDWRRVEPEENE